MEYLDGREFSVNMLARSGELESMVCRRKPVEVRVHPTGTSRPIRVEEGLSQLLARELAIKHMVGLLMRSFQLGGLFNSPFRTREELQKRPCLLEINGRMAGGMPYIQLTGLNLAVWSIRIALTPADDPLPEIPKAHLSMWGQERSDVFIMSPSV